MISVCLTTYNGETYLRQQLESIVEQLSPGDEVIISDDGSTDETQAIVEEIKAQHEWLSIRWILNQGQHGYTPNFENALRNAEGEYIFLSDQDDIWLPGKVQRCVRLLQEADFVVHDARIIDGKGDLLAPSFYAVRHPRRTLVGNVLKIGFLGCCMAFRRELVRCALPFPSNYTLCSHDNWLTLLGMARFRYKVCDECLVAYRRHGGNISSGEINTHRSTWFRLKYRAYLVWNVIKRRKN